MNDEPENKNYLYENLVLALSRLGQIREVVKRIMSRKSYSRLPEATKDDIEVIKDLSKEIRK